MAAVDPSIYRRVTIAKNGKDVDIRAACTGIDIFESILSPNITAKIEIVNSAGTLKDDKGDYVTLYDGMKIRGGENVTFYIDNNADQNEPIVLNLIVSSISNVYRSEQLEYFTLKLVSREAFENQYTFLTRNYSRSARIDNHVKDILNESFIGATLNAIIDPTSNNMGFNGNQKKPFEMLLKLASNAVFGETDNASAGFFFYQTKTGFRFRSIDNLMAQEPVSTFVLTARNDSRYDFKSTPELPSLDYKIINYEVTENQNMVEKLSRGAYSTNRRFFDPVTQIVTGDETVFTGNEYIGPMKNLGTIFEEEDLSFDGIDLTKIPTQYIVETFDRGTLDTGVTQETTGLDIEKVLSQRKVRYNTLFTQRVSLQVPLATNVEVGNVIKLLFPKVNAEGKEDFDSAQLSGLYIVTDLRHHFDPEYSLTTMNVVRDTFGLTGTNN